MIQVFFTGRLGKDCRAGATQTGVAVCSFPVATESGYGDKKQTVWVDCSLWGKAAEGGLPAYLVKGQQVAVIGELGTREHEGKMYITCRVDKLDLVGGKGSSDSSSQTGNTNQASSGPSRPAQQQPAQQAPQDDSFDDDIPFD